MAGVVDRGKLLPEKSLFNSIYAVDSRRLDCQNAPMTGKDMIRLLEEHGWLLERIRGSHHLMKKGSEAIPVPVHGKKELKRGTESKIIKQAGLK